MKKRLEPYGYWSAKQLFEGLTVNTPKELKSYQLLCEAYRYYIISKDWDVFRDFNGCTLVQDTLHPSPACFLHDALWMTGSGGVQADLLFLRVMRVTGVGKFKAYRRFVAVRLAWMLWYRFSMPNTKGANKLVEVLNNELSIDLKR